jgi:hypothetical protein
MFDLFDQKYVSVLLLAGTREVKTSDNSTVELANNNSVEPGKIEELPGFQLHSISVNGSRQNILRVNFSYEVVDANRKRTGVADCQIDFDLEAKCYPIKSHQILKNGEGEYILDCSETLTQKSENEYEVKSLKSFSQLKKSSNDVGSRLFEEINSKTVFSLDDPPESDFTLSAFGLPEPPGIEWNKPFPWYLVFAGIGTACLGVFFFLRSRSKRVKV